ncbi:cobalamin biosynthesis protein CobQ [Jannaschia sp. EhC01]|nr:cobalamin biosynthesis protein CobQ [Jannaschia sp. EhC01]
MFGNGHSWATQRHREVYEFYERLYTTMDLAAALFFIVGSIMFFNEDLTYTGTWFFLVGSILFAAKPASRFVREFHLAHLPLPGDSDDEGKTVRILDDDPS